MRRRRSEIPADGVFLLTGYISDNRLLRDAGVEIDPDTCGPKHDPETYETNVKGIYVIGAMVAGKASGGSSSRTAGFTARWSFVESPRNRQIGKLGNRQVDCPRSAAISRFPDSPISRF